jgi:hypothetical protein
MATTSLVDVGGGFEAAFYAVFVIYLLGMLLLAIRGFFLKRTAKTEGGVEAEMVRAVHATTMPQHIQHTMCRYAIYIRMLLMPPHMP